MIALAPEFDNHSFPIYNTVAADIFHKFYFDCFCMVNYAEDIDERLLKLHSCFQKPTLKQCCVIFCLILKTKSTVVVI